MVALARRGKTRIKHVSTQHDLVQMTAGTQGRPRFCHVRLHPPATTVWPSGLAARAHTPLGAAALDSGWLKDAAQGSRPSAASHSFRLPSQAAVRRRLPLPPSTTCTHATVSSAAWKLPSLRPVSAE